MNTKIVFLGQKSSLSMGFAEAIMASPWQILDAADQKGIETLVRAGDIPLFIFAPTGDHKDWLWCKDLLSRYPVLPAIYLLSNDHSYLRQADLGAHRLVVKPLTSIKSFLDTVDELASLGNHLMTRSAPEKQQIHIGAQFAMYNLDHVIDRVLVDLQQFAASENAIWIDAEEFAGAIRGQSSQSKDWPEFHLDRRNSVRTVNFLDSMSIAKSLLPFPKKDVNAAAQATQVVGNGGSQDILLPLLDRGFGQPKAFILLQKARLASTQRAIAKIEQRLSDFSLVIDYSHKYQLALDQSYGDSLSSLYNDRYLRFVLPEVIAHAEKKSQPFSVLFMDVDFFKSVNDMNGHVVGSKVLTEIGATVQGCLDLSDMAFRYGGDEFVVVSLGSDVDAARALAERIRHEVEQTSFTIDGNALNVTVSIGLASYPNHAKTAERIIRMADEAMYSGKNGSRNIVYVAS